MIEVELGGKIHRVENVTGMEKRIIESAIKIGNKKTGKQSQCQIGKCSDCNHFFCTVHKDMVL